jgi:hypothetical protein
VSYTSTYTIEERAMAKRLGEIRRRIKEIMKQHERLGMRLNMFQVEQRQLLEKLGNKYGGKI